MAAPNLGITIRGLDSLERNLLDFADQYGPKNAISALRAPLRSSLRSVAEQIRSNTPVDTGELRESTSISITQPTRRLLRSNYINNDSIIVGRVGWFWGRGEMLWLRSLFVEFGNRHTPARPVLKPALRTLQSVLVADFAPAMAKSMEATARRLGRRALRGTLRRR